MAKRKGGRKRPMETKNNQAHEDAKEKRILLLEAENIKLKEQIELMRTSREELVSEGAEVFEKTAKAIADLIKSKKDRISDLCPECKHKMIPISLNNIPPFIIVGICINPFCKFCNVLRSIK